jgi:hypothetical protein
MATSDKVFHAADLQTFGYFFATSRTFDWAADKIDSWFRPDWFENLI